MAKTLKFSVTHAPAALIAAFIISFMFFYAANVHAAAHTHPISLNQSPEQQQIGQLTAQLNQLLNRYRHADNDEQTQIEQQLNALASERQQLLGEVIESDPQTVLKYALPEKVQAQFPAQVQDKFEQWVHAQGDLEIYFEDHEDHENSRLRFYLKQDDHRFPLSLVGSKLPADTSGHRVRVQGVLVSKGEEPIIATNDEQIMLAAGGSGDPENTTSTAELSNTTGEQRTAVFLVNFQDNPSNKPWTVEQAEHQFFNVLNNFFLENSYQKTWLTGDVLGWYTLPINSTGCGQMEIADAADNAALADNIDLSQYDRFVYVFPQNGCTWGGFATVGGSPSRAWVKADLYGVTAAHEMGHNFGLFHSHGLNCEGDATDTNCKSLTYGDSLDTMGSRYAHYNAFQKERLGWLNQSQTPPIVTIEQSGSYAIELFETTTGNAKALKVFKDIDPFYGQSRWYYMEFRQAVGVDEIIESDFYLDADNIQNGVTMHLVTEGVGDSSFLLDMTPESTTSSSNFADLYDPALTTGNSFTDSASGLTITTEYTDSQTATVYVSVEGSAPSSCSHANPVVTVSPTESQWVSAGTQVDFTLNVTNQDSNSCSITTFNIDAAVPSGWNVNNPQLMLDPGETGSTVVSITSSSDAMDDFYDITLTASNSDKGNYSNTTTATYVVSSSSSNKAPDAVNDNVTMTAIEPIVINVMSNDIDPDADAIYITAIGSAAKGDVKVNADGTVVYTPAKRFKDSDSFTYTISDGQASDTAAVALSLQSSSNDEGGSKGGG